MSQFIAFIKNILKSGLKGNLESENIRKSIVINLFTLIGVTFIFIYGMRSVFNGSYAYAGVLFLTAFITFINFIYLRVTGNTQNAGYTLVILLFFLELYFLINGGEENTAYLWYYVYPILSLFTLGTRKGSIFISSLFVISVVFLIWEPDFMVVYEHNLKLRFISTFIAVTLMAYTYEYIRYMTYKTLTAANEKKTYYLIKIMEQKKELLVQSEKLRLSNKELVNLSLVARKTDNAVAIMNPKGNIEWINNGYTRMYGYDLKNIHSLKDKKLVGKESNLNIKDLVNIWFGEKKTINYESLNTTINGGKVWAHTTLTPIIDESGKLQKLISIDSDISLLKEAEEEIRNKNNDITDSIRYAKRIQEAVMPALSDFKVLFPNSFVFNLPKDIVSGDFFWSIEKDDVVLLTVADCTGHGVPGAFMSLIGMNFLNRIIIEKGITTPGLILDNLRTSLKISLHQTEEEGGPTDALDLALIAINKKEQKLEYAGAMNPLYIIRNGELIETKADKIPLGIYYELQHKYNNHVINYQPGDLIYIFSDGFIDQFGGKTGEKFKYRRFRQMLLEISKYPCLSQEEKISKYFNQWKKDYEQVDDVLVIGIKL